MSTAVADQDKQTAAANRMRGFAVDTGVDHALDITGPRIQNREYIYWKLCDYEDCIYHTAKGWIVIGPALQPATAIEYTEFQATKHATPLKQYGKWRSEGDHLGKKRFLQLFESGGAHEIPLEQAIAYNWHRIPEMVELFPALAEVPVLYCPEGCPKSGPQERVFTSQARVDKHMRVMHSDSAGARTTGNVIKDAIEGMQGQLAPQSQELDAKQMALLATAMVKAMQDAGVLEKAGK